MTNRRYLFALACLGMLAFGFVLTSLGASLPNIIATFGIDMAQAGTLFLLLSFGILAGSVVFGPMVDRRGYKGMLLLALALIFVGLETIAFAASLGWLRAGVAMIGFGGGIVNGGTNALVADISTDSRGAGLNFLGVFFGVGAAGYPFALAMLSGSYSQATIVAAVGALVLIPLGMTAFGAFPAPKQSQGFPLAQARSLFGDWVLLLMGLMLFLQSGMEITVGGWTSTFFIQELGLGANRALVYLSLYWVGMMLARLVLGAVLKTVPAKRVILACIALAFAGTMLLLWTRSVGVAAVGVFLIGAGLAATFPTVLGFVGDRYAQISGTAFSLVIVMALIGGMLMPYATGYFGNQYGLRGSLGVVPGALVLQVLLLIVVTRRLGTKPPGAAAP